MCTVVVVLSDFIFHLSVIVHPFSSFHFRRLRVFCSASRHSEVNAVVFSDLDAICKICDYRLGDGDEGVGPARG